MHQITSKRASLQGLPVAHRELLRQVESELKIRYYAQKTRKNYLGHIRRFFFWLRGAPVPDDPESIKRYLLLDYEGYLRDLAVIADSKFVDVITIHQFTLPFSNIIVMDQGSYDIILFAQWANSGGLFVTRLNDKAKYTALDNHPLP